MVIKSMKRVKIKDHILGEVDAIEMTEEIKRAIPVSDLEKKKQEIDSLLSVK